MRLLAALSLSLTACATVQPHVQPVAQSQPSARPHTPPREQAVRLDPTTSQIFPAASTTRVESSDPSIVDVQMIETSALVHSHAKQGQATVRFWDGDRLTQEVTV